METNNKTIPQQVYRLETYIWLIWRKLAYKVLIFFYELTSVWKIFFVKVSIGNLQVQGDLTSVFGTYKSPGELYKGTDKLQVELRIIYKCLVGLSGVKGNSKWRHLHK